MLARTPAAARQLASRPPAPTSNVKLSDKVVSGARCQAVRNTSTDVQGKVTAMRRLYRGAGFIAAIFLSGGGFAHAAAPTATTPFEACSPLGCAQQRVTGTVDTGPNATRLRATATDGAAASQFSVRLQLVYADGGIRERSFSVDDRTVIVESTYPGPAPEMLRVSACAVPPGTCNTKVIPLA